jgi:hypothetical protein
MNKPTLSMIAALTAFAGACAPLSQAGLVYASRGQAGLTLASGTPETPGLEVNIGMKINDFAYIPVVVGRPCEFTDNTDCDQTLIHVQGNNDVSERDDPPTRTEPTPPTPPTFGPKAMQNPPPPAPSAAQLDELRRRAAEDAAAILAKTNTRHDALSVYGTFGSEGSTSNATQPGAGLSLNRVFSTGVASQNLTEGERDARRAEAEGVADARRTEAMTRCMERAVSSAPEGAGRNQLLAACAVAAGGPAS